MADHRLHELLDVPGEVEGLKPPGLRTGAYGSLAHIASHQR